ncbi:MAG: methanogenesis marker 17 protein [Methanosarcinales archaeon]
MKEIKIVESPDKSGAERYEEVIKDVLADLGLHRALGHIKVYVDPKEPVFITAGTIRSGLPLIKLKDFAKVTLEFDKVTYKYHGIKIEFTSEEYVADLLKILWSKFSKEKIDQPDRRTLLIKTKESEENWLKELIVKDPREELKMKIIDALMRITPEGFRVRDHYTKGSNILFIASEDPIKPEWINKANAIIKEIGGKNAASF